MNHKLIAVIFVILLLASAVPFGFTTDPTPLIFGWLPLPLAYWWSLMFVNLAFVLWVSNSFIKEAEKKKKDKENNKEGEEND